jgi:hypothetical protein
LEPSILFIPPCVLYEVRISSVTSPKSLCMGLPVMRIDYPRNTRLRPGRAADREKNRAERAPSHSFFEIFRSDRRLGKRKNLNRFQLEYGRRKRENRFV